MIVWIIVLLVLLLILICPVGIDAAYQASQFSLKLKIGPFRKALFPREKRDKKKKKKEKQEKPEPKEPEEEQPKKKQRFTLDDILTLAEIGLDALHRFRVHLSVDLFLLYWTAAAADPYDAVMQYGRINAALGSLMGKAHAALKIRDEDVQTTIDLTLDHPKIETRLILSIQIWEVLLIGIAAGAAGLRWMIRKKRDERAAASAATERSKQDGEL